MRASSVCLVVILINSVVPSIGSLLPSTGALAEATALSRQVHSYRTDVLRNLVTKRAVDLADSAIESTKYTSNGGGAIYDAQVEKFLGDSESTFTALATNGTVDVTSGRYLLHSYFARAHGWLIRGVAPKGSQEALRSGPIASKYDIFLRSALKDWGPKRRLTAGDVATVAADLERTYFSEAVTLLEEAYVLAGVEKTAEVLTEDLYQILDAFGELVGRMSDVDGDGVDPSVVADAQRPVARFHDTLMQTSRDMGAYALFDRQKESNPFVSPTWSLFNVADIVRELVLNYRNDHSLYCQEMTHSLMDLAPTGSGRIHLNRLISEERLPALLPVLRQLGSLDETGRSGPKLLIANFVASKANCISTSANYGVCCPSQCEDLMRTIEGRVRAPTASPGQLLSIVGNLSSSSVNAPRHLPAALKAKMQEVADTDGGSVELYGRLFAQWLHFAFPNECPYPHVNGAQGALTAMSWLHSGGSLVATPLERAQQVRILDELTQAAMNVQELPEDSDLSDEEMEELLAQWRREEELLLPLHEICLATWLFRLGFQVTLLLLVSRTVYQLWAVSVPRFWRNAKKTDPEEPPVGGTKLELPAWEF